MNKKQLIAAMASTEHFQTKKAAGEFLNEFLNIISDTVAEGTEVRIAGFGKFEKFERSNGKTTPKFRPYAALKTRVG